MPFEIIMRLRMRLSQKLLELEDITEDERKELLSKIDSLESIVRMLELKTKNSHDHGTNVISVSSLSIHSSSVYSRVEDFSFFFFLFYVTYFYIYICAYSCMHCIIGAVRKIWDTNLFSFYHFLLRYFFTFLHFFFCM